MKDRKTGINRGREEGPSILADVRDHLNLTKPDFASAIDRIDKNWSSLRSRSKQNWRLKPGPLKKESGYKTNPAWSDSEVLLERGILEDCREKKMLVWNQMPTASGLLPLPPKGDDGRRRQIPSEGRRAIDLVFQPNGTDAVFEFIELKVRRNNGLTDTLQHAVLELLEYGLLYLFSRIQRKELGYSEPTKENTYEVLDATEIRLRVLAKADYYENQEVGSVPVETINDALKSFIDSNQILHGKLKMDIGFQVLGKEDDPCAAFLAKKPFSTKERSQ